MSDTTPDSLRAELQECDKIKVEDGLEFDPLSLLNQQLLERREFPATLFDEPVPWRFWKLCLAHVQSMPTVFASPELLAARRVCRAYYRSLVKNRVEAMTPFRSQLDLHDLLILAAPNEGGLAGMDEVLRCHRETVYLCFNNEYLGRKVG